MEQGGPQLTRTMSLQKREIWPPVTHRKARVKVEAEIRVMFPQAKEPHRWPAKPQKPGRDLDQMLPHGLRKGLTLPTPRS